MSYAAVRRHRMNHMPAPLEAGGATPHPAPRYGTLGDALLAFRKDTPKSSFRMEVRITEAELQVVEQAASAAQQNHGEWVESALFRAALHQVDLSAYADRLRSATDTEQFMLKMDETMPEIVRLAAPLQGMTQTAWKRAALLWTANAAAKK